VRWLITEWCNYRCSYCFQAKHQRVPDTHSFANFPVERWLEAFELHFSKSRLSLAITGGEPMLDVPNMRRLLDFLSASRWCEAIRIDTNASWNPTQYRDVRKEKIIFNCSYHPSMVDEQKYLERLKAIQDCGFEVGMINFVLTRGQLAKFRVMREKLADLGIPINANPELQERYSFDAELAGQLRGAILEDDLYFKLGKSPKGRHCLYPSIAYEMGPTGYLTVGCIEKRGASIFDLVLPSIGNKSIACPHDECSCIDKYSFLSEFKRNTSTNILGTYCDLLLKEQQNSR